MVVVGLTGGIGSGKTAVSKRFAQRGVPVIDTDILARELVSPGQLALHEIATEFGSACLDETGNLNRSYLRSRVFADPGLRQRLEAILHPRIRQAVRERLATLNAPYCVVVVPLLVETQGLLDLMQRVLVVDVSETVQIQRVLARDGVDEKQVRRILNVQAARAQRLAIADDIIENNGSLEELDAAVAVLHRKYRALATDRCL